MKKYLIVFAALIFFIPSIALADMVSFRVGFFFPQAKSDLWDIEFENMNFQRSDFQNSSFGFSYEYFFSRELSFMFSIDGYTKQKTGSYVGYVQELIDNYDYAFNFGEGQPISHVFSVSVTPIQASLKLTPLGRKMRVIPYVGGGVGLYLWNVRLQGEMIDFDQPEEFEVIETGEIVWGWPVFLTDAREESKLKIGFHAFGGLMIPIASRISAEAEFKYNFVRGTFTEAFEGFEAFDLSGYQISIGLNYWF